MYVLSEGDDMDKSLAGRGSGETPGPLVIRKQGSFAVGGTVVQHPGVFDPLKGTPDGQTLHGDHAYVQYQIPENPRRFPLVFVHGAGQFSRCWGSTPDGREGFQNIFLRRRFPVYLVDVPRRGGAGRSTLPVSLTATPDDQVPGITCSGSASGQTSFRASSFPATRNH